MDRYCENRLTVVGEVRQLKAFYQNEHGMAESGGRHFELMEHSPKRHVWQFGADAPPLGFLRNESRKWPLLVFLLDYDCEDDRVKGLVKATDGRLRHHRVSY